MLSVPYHITSVGGFQALNIIKMWSGDTFRIIKCASLQSSVVQSAVGIVAGCTISSHAFTVALEAIIGPSKCFNGTVGGRYMQTM